METAPVTLPEGGTIRPITRWGEEVMHHQAAPVTQYDESLLTLVKDMVATMRAAEGVGLAACQIGVDLALFVFDCPDEDGIYHAGVVCNPLLELPEGRERRLDDGEEGCLSFPGAFVPCARPDRARVSGTDHEGKPVSFTGTGLLARCLQHETDHTLGTVFGDRISTRAMKKLRKQMESASADYPPDWPTES
jgi:peptide deformylase